MKIQLELKFTWESTLSDHSRLFLLPHSDASFQQNHSNFQQNNTEQSRSQTKHLNRQSDIPSSLFTRLDLPLDMENKKRKKKLKNKRLFYPGVETGT